MRVNVLTPSSARLNVPEKLVKPKLVPFVSSGSVCFSTSTVPRRTLRTVQTTSSP
jgi:hypothetical protein